MHRREQQRAEYPYNDRRYPQQGYPPQGYPNGYSNGYSNGYPQGYPPHGYPPQGYPYQDPRYQQANQPFYRRDDGYDNRYGSREYESVTSNTLAALGSIGQKATKKAAKQINRKPEAQSSNISYDDAKIEGEYLEGYAYVDYDNGGGS